MFGRLVRHPAWKGIRPILTDPGPAVGAAMWRITTATSRRFVTVTGVELGLRAAR